MLPAELLQYTLHSGQAYPRFLNLPLVEGLCQHVLDVLQLFGRELRECLAKEPEIFSGSSSTPRIAPGSVIALVSRLCRKSSKYVTEKM
jgi:hypothetical protein